MAIDRGHISLHGWRGKEKNVRILLSTELLAELFPTQMADPEMRNMSLSHVNLWVDADVLGLTEANGLDMRVSPDGHEWHAVNLDDTQRDELWGYFVSLRKRQEEKGIDWGCSSRVDSK